MVRHIVLEKFSLGAKNIGLRLVKKDDANFGIMKDWFTIALVQPKLEYLTQSFKVILDIFF